ISAPASTGRERKNKAAPAESIAIATKVPRKAARPGVPSLASHAAPFSAPVDSTTLSDEEACRKMLDRVEASALSSGGISATVSELWLENWIDRTMPATKRSPHTAARDAPGTIRAMAARLAPAKRGLTTKTLRKPKRRRTR